MYFTDPTGLYGNKCCKHYERRCKEAGGAYYCHVAKTVCVETTDKTNEEKWGDCVRSCLQEDDKKSCGGDSEKRQTSARIVISHLSCWTKCAADPDANPFDGEKQNNGPWDSCW